MPYGWRRKASKEWFIFLILKDVPKNGYCERHSSGMNKNVFLQVIDDSAVSVPRVAV